MLIDAEEITVVAKFGIGSVVATATITEYVSEDVDTIQQLISATN